MRSQSRHSRAFLLSALTFLCGCQEMRQGEYGVVYSNLPRALGGGVKEKVVEPGEREVIFPWESLYRVDTTRKAVAWGGGSEGILNEQDVQKLSDYVETRTLDGNEVDLAITVLYRVDPSALGHIIQRVGIDPDSIRRLVAAVSRADIRTHMNTLHTKDFFTPERLQAALAAVKKAIESRLGPEGILIDDVIYNDHRFERRLADGVDRSYQEQIDRTQATNQETEQEEKKVATVVELKRREFNEAQAKVNRVLEQAKGYLRQATLQGDAYLASKKNEAEQIKAVGLAEVEGLTKQIEALSGPGGTALLRYAIARELLANNARFLLVNSAQVGKGGIDLSRIDVNDLMRQADLFAISPELNAPLTSPGGETAAASEKKAQQKTETSRIPLEKVIP